MKNNLPINQNQFLLYTGNDGKINVDVFLKDETVWLTQKAMGQLFGVNTPAISKHLSNIFESGELQKESTLSKLETVQKEGKRLIKREIEYYNLDAIISIGYRVKWPGVGPAQVVDWDMVIAEIWPYMSLEPQFWPQNWASKKDRN